MLLVTNSIGCYVCEPARFTLRSFGQLRAALLVQCFKGVSAIDGWKEKARNSFKFRSTFKIHSRK